MPLPNLFLYPRSRLARLKFRISLKLGDIFDFHISHFHSKKNRPSYLTHFKTASPHFFSLFQISLLRISESRLCQSFLYLVSSYLSFFFNCSLTPCLNRERSDSLCLLLSTPYSLSRSFSFLAPRAKPYRHKCTTRALGCLHVLSPKCATFQKHDA